MSSEYSDLRGIFSEYFWPRVSSSANISETSLRAISRGRLGDTPVSLSVSISSSACSRNRFLGIFSAEHSWDICPPEASQNNVLFGNTLGSHHRLCVTCVYKCVSVHMCGVCVYIFFYLYIFLVVGIRLCGYFLSSNLHVLIPRYHS